MGIEKESLLGRAYRLVYEGICGKHPRLRPWHYQYLSGYYLNRSLRRILSSVKGGSVLDVGCGDAPYRDWFGRSVQYIGIDMESAKGVTHVIDGASQWPLDDESVDIILCTQVLEHVEHLSVVLHETKRVLRAGGTLITSAPFIYNEHGAPNDYRRFSSDGLKLQWPGWRVISQEKQGNAGSTLAILLLSWFDQNMNVFSATRIIKAIILPLWIIVSLFINILAILLDKLDFTGSFYSNALIVLEKPNPELGYVLE